MQFAKTAIKDDNKQVGKGVWWNENQRCLAEIHKTVFKHYVGFDLEL